MSGSIRVVVQNVGFAVEVVTNSHAHARTHARTHAVTDLCNVPRPPNTEHFLSWFHGNENIALNGLIIELPRVRNPAILALDKRLDQQISFT